MSSASDRSKGKARLAATIIVIFLIALTALIVFESSYLGWPFSVGKLSDLFGHSPKAPIAPNGTLIVQVSLSETYSNSPFVSPFQGALIQVYAGTNDVGAPVATNVTSSFGSVTFQLFPAQYAVTVTNSLTNSTPLIVLNTYSNVTTSLNVDLNKTNYPAYFFDIVNPDFTSDLPIWSPIYADVYSNSKLPIANLTTYLSLGSNSSDNKTTIVSLNSTNGTNSFDNFTLLSVFPATVPINVASQTLSSTGSLLLELKLVSPTNVQGVQNIALTTIGSNYTLYYYNSTSDAPVTPPQS